MCLASCRVRHEGVRCDSPASQPRWRADSFDAIRSALEVYYKRTLTGQFHGQYKVSLAFEDLIRQMVEPSVARRLATCAKGLTHPFFSLRPPSVMSGDGQCRNDRTGQRKAVLTQSCSVCCSVSTVRSAATPSPLSAGCVPSTPTIVVEEPSTSRPALTAIKPPQLIANPQWTTTASATTKPKTAAPLIAQKATPSSATPKAESTGSPAKGGGKKAGAPTSSSRKKADIKIFRDEPSNSGSAAAGMPMSRAFEYPTIVADALSLPLLLLRSREADCQWTETLTSSL